MKTARVLIHDRFCTDAKCWVRAGSAGEDCRALDELLNRTEGEAAESIKENVQALQEAAGVLGVYADRAARDVATNEFYAPYPEKTAYRDGQVGGMGGPAGDLAGLLGPDVARHLAWLLSEVERMGTSYPEMIREHNRELCEDHACTVFGHVIEIAKNIKSVLPGDDTNPMKDGK